MERPEITVENVMKVIDVSYYCIYSETVRFLKERHKEYTDNNGDMGEHLYNIVTAYEDEEFEPDEYEEFELVRKELAELRKLADENDAAYVRFV